MNRILVIDPHLLAMHSLIVSKSTPDTPCKTFKITLTRTTTLWQEWVALCFGPCSAHLYDRFFSSTIFCSDLNFASLYHNLTFSNKELTVLEQAVNHRIDLRGMEYPISKLETRLTLKKMAEGEVLEVLTDFVPIRQAISLLIRELGYAYELMETDKPDFHFFIQKI